MEANIKENKIEHPKQGIFQKPWIKSVIGILVFVLILVGLTVWKIETNQIKIENSTISSPVINLSPTSMGILEEIYVKPGEKVEANTSVAKVGNEMINTKVAGIITSVNHAEGQVFSPGMPVASMINLDEERVVGKIDENKGLDQIKVGQIATFTVDAFGSKKFEGVVDEVSPISDDSSVVFNISDKRAVKQFDVKIKFDTSAHPEFKEGMSAKIIVYKK